MPRVLSAPNVVSLSRVAVFAPLALVLAATGRWVGAAAALVLFGVSDGVDGRLARHRRQVTRLGAALDVAADRVGVVVVVAGLAVLHVLPVWIPATVVGADVVLAVTALTRHRRVPTARVTRLGKARTALIMVGLPTLVATTGTPDHWTHTAALAVLSLGCLLHVAATVGYLRRLLTNTPEEPVVVHPGGARVDL